MPNVVRISCALNCHFNRYWEHCIRARSTEMVVLWRMIFSLLMRSTWFTTHRKMGCISSFNYVCVLCIVWQIKKQKRQLIIKCINFICWEGKKAYIGFEYHILPFTVIRIVSNIYYDWLCRIYIYKMASCRFCRLSNKTHSLLQTKSYIICRSASN